MKPRRGISDFTRAGGDDLDCKSRRSSGDFKIAKDLHPKRLRWVSSVYARLARKCSSLAIWSALSSSYQSLNDSAILLIPPLSVVDQVNNLGGASSRTVSLSGAAFSSAGPMRGGKGTVQCLPCRDLRRK